MYTYMCINKQEHESVTTEQASEQMLMPVRQRKRGKQDGGVVGRTRAFLRVAQASPKPAQKEAMENQRERSVRIPSDSTSSSLHTMLLSLLPLLLYPQEGSRFPY